MKKEDVPQDDANTLQGKMTKLYYAKDGESFTGVQSVGWEPENVVLQQAWENIGEEVQQAKSAVLNGSASPILYYMHKNLMEPQILAGYIGLPAFMVKLHFRPFFFKMLSNKTLEKYAFAFRITVAQLCDVNQLQ
ncbi:MAG: hypothetical protein U0T73_03900 [Chitinophagales bacterium]